LSIFTANPEFGEDATALFNLLTGYSAPPHWNRMIIAPLGLHEAVLGLISRETEHARAGRPARIIAKMNSIVDADVIGALYSASQAGVEIDLLVRGICCLRPGVRGVSENIRVLAVVDRYLEHSRIFCFGNGGSEEVYLSSADWMPRNFRRRVELMWPVLDEGLKRRVIDEVLGTMLADGVKSWSLQSDGSYERHTPHGADGSDKPVRSQLRFMEIARERARDSELLLSPRQLAPAPAPTAAMAKLRKRGKAKKRRKRRDDD
jgi:polyphosphate kinase